MFDSLSDELLLSSFKKAKALRLEAKFIELLRKEINNRALTSTHQSEKRNSW